MRIVDRIVLLLEEKHISARQMLLDLDMSLTSVNDWKTERAKPSIAAVTKIADYLNVSTDYLINGKVDSTSDELKDWIALYDRINTLPEDERARISSYFKGYIDALIKDND